MRLNVGIWLSFTALTAIAYGLGSWMPSFLTAAGFTLEQALQASFVFNACSILGALAAGWLIQAVGSRGTILASTGLTCLLLVGFGPALESIAGDPMPAERLSIYVLAAAVGAVASVAVATLYAMAAMLYPPEIRSSGIGLGMTAGRVGGTLMSFAGGYLLDFADGSAILLFRCPSAVRPLVDKRWLAGARAPSSTRLAALPLHRVLRTGTLIVETPASALPDRVKTLDLRHQLTRDGTPWTA
jgi:MFS family permease